MYVRVHVGFCVCMLCRYVVYVYVLYARYVCYVLYVFRMLCNSGFNVCFECVGVYVMYWYERVVLFMVVFVCHVCDVRIECNHVVYAMYVNVVVFVLCMYAMYVGIILYVYVFCVMHGVYCVCCVRVVCLYVGMFSMYVHYVCYVRVYFWCAMYVFVHVWYVCASCV